MSLRKKKDIQIPRAEVKRPSVNDAPNSSGYFGRNSVSSQNNRQNNYSQESDQKVPNKKTQYSTYAHSKAAADYFNNASKKFVKEIEQKQKRAEAAEQQRLYSQRQKSYAQKNRARRRNASNTQKDSPWAQNAGQNVNVQPNNYQPTQSFNQSQYGVNQDTYKDNYQPSFRQQNTNQNDNEAWIFQQNNQQQEFYSDAAVQKRKKPKSRKSSAKPIISLILVVVIIIGLAWAMREYVFQAYEIPSGSMESTIMTGDMVFAEKISHYFVPVKRGDIVTFKDPEVEGRILIKRCIATEGQTVDIKDNKFYVDGVEIDEPYTQGKPTKTLNRSKISFPYTIPEGEIWMMGDNRTNSQDSRYYGSVPVENVIGKALVVYWPTSDFKLLM